MAAACWGGRAGAAADATGADESAWIRVLQGAGSVGEKDEACVRLQRVGTERAVPALGALLADPQLSHSARFALESMPGRAAGQALLAALHTTSGSERIGVIGSLGVRRESSAIPELARLLAAAVTTDPEDRGGEGAALAAALGRMENDDAQAALAAHWSAAIGALRAALVDGLLAHAHRLLAAGTPDEARAVFQEIFQRETDTPLRVAAHAGVLRSTGGGAVDLLLSALTGPGGPEQAAALRLWPDLAVPGAPEAVERALPGMSPVVQAALLGGWCQRADAPSLAAVTPLLASASDDVRVAAIRLLGRMGGEGEVGELLSFAAGPGPLRVPARWSLAAMQGAGVADRLIDALREAQEAVRVEAARTLGQRGEVRAVPALMTLASEEGSAVRVAAWRALVRTAGDHHVEAVLAMVDRASDRARREEGARALAMVLERLQPGDGAPSLRAVLEAAKERAPSTRAALLPACSVLARPTVREALRAALRDADAAVRTAAARAVTASADSDLMPDLLRLATDPGEAFREAATQACLRLLRREAVRFPGEARVEVLRALAAGQPNTAQKRLLLAGLAGGGSAAEFELAERFLAEADVWDEAVRALVTMAPQLADPRGVAELLGLLLGCALEPDTRRSAEAALRTLEGRAAAASGGPRARQQEG